MHKPIFAFGTVLVTSQVFAAQFQIKITNLGVMPLSPPFVCFSDSSFDIFKLGRPASLGIKSIAEVGQVSPIAADAFHAGTHVASYAGGAKVITPGNSATFKLSTDPTRPYLQFASMLAITNDGFIGESVSSARWRVFEFGLPCPRTRMIYGNRVWDAGTENNSQNRSDLIAFGGLGNPADSSPMIRTHSGVSVGVGDAWNSIPMWNLLSPVAKVEVTPVSIRKKLPPSSD